MAWDDDRSALRTQFDRDGFVALRGFLSADELTQMTGEVDRFVRDVAPTLPREHVFFESIGDSDTLKQLQNLHEYDAYFGEWMTDSKFRRVAELLLDDDVICRNLQYFNKPPQIGAPTPPHQDGYYFMLDPCSAVTLWLALEPVDETNGCVRYVPGSHQLGMRAHGRTATLGFSQGIVDYPCPHDEQHEVALPADAGDLLVHHALTIHRADGNNSQSRSRRALGFVYYGAAARTDERAHAAYQDRLREEMIAAGKI